MMMAPSCLEMKFLITVTDRTKTAKLFVGDRFAYVADIQGFNHIDLSVPTSPSEPTRIKTNSIGWRQIVSNGSGLAITDRSRHLQETQVA